MPTSAWRASGAITRLGPTRASGCRVAERATHWMPKPETVTVSDWFLLDGIAVNKKTFELIDSSSTGQPDDDECALGRHNCVPPYECFNTKGSFRCRQRSRYAPQAVSRVTGTSTSTSTSTSTTTTTTTARPVYYTHTTRNDPQYRPVYQPNNQQVEYNRYQGSCGIGFERNALGACVGKYLFPSNFVLLTTINKLIFFIWYASRNNV